MAVSARSQRYAVLLFGAASIACAPAGRQGEVISITQESAIIIWDAATKTQHFIRRASFDTKSKDFGFLVPTPTRPALSEVDAAIFGYLESVTRPPARRGENVRTPDQLAAGKSAPRPAVTLLESVTVAGLDAVVLEANDARALDRWLRNHGYASGPELAEWFRPYIAAKWITTAFKISKGQSRAERVATSAVRMSFKTDQPFFPYREPATRSSAARALEVYFVSGERVEGRIGATGKWPGVTLWAQPLEGIPGLLTRAKLPANAVPANAWLTRFIDSSSPRPGTDELYFSRAADQSRYMDVVRLEAELQIKEAAGRPTSNRIPVSGDMLTAMLRQADQSQRDGRNMDAVRILRRAARAGSGAAALRLGDIYEKGALGIPRDHAESLQWYQIARGLGMKDAAAKR